MNQPGPAAEGGSAGLLVAPAFAAAWLLFAIEPMLAKLLLPALGGSPATWAACMLAFQLLLLAGYAYAYLGARYLRVQQQALLHALLLVAAATSLLATRLTATGAPVLGAFEPALAVPWLVLRRVGLPFAILASTTPLLARWARALGRPAPAIYAVSNAGALLGLLSYPLLLERFVALPAQFALWAAGFVLFGLSVLPLCVVAARTPSVAAVVVRRAATSRQRLYWLSCAFLPAALLLAVTNYITVDVAATPLLWVVPLALYLASFILAFSALGPLLRGPALVMWVTGSLWLGLNAFAQGAVSLAGQITPALLALTGGALLCHGELSRERPREADASGYYLILAGGGVLGGAFVSLFAPLVFSDFYELEVATLLTFVLLVGMARRRSEAALPRGLRLLVYLGSGLCLPLVTAEAWVRHASSGVSGRVVERRRGFLGPLRVVDLAQARVLTHGRIQHGMQLRAAEQRRTATMYFGAGTGVERVLDGFHLEKSRRLGVVGLGVGTLATYGRAGESLRFYELDRNVIELGRKDFSFLSDARASVSIVEGDGRLALAHEAPQAFDVLVLDAFSSDAVPVHLLTREAFEVYARQLAGDGVLLANVSNRHLAVERVVRASARAIGLSSVVVESRGATLDHGVRAVWAVMARDRAVLADLTRDLPRKRESGPDVLWTDGRASVLSVLR